MSEDPETILDSFEDEPVRPWYFHWSVMYGPVLLLITGVFFRLMHWPWASLLMAAGLTLLIVRSIIFFFTRKRAFDEWFYFLGRITLVTVLVVNYGFRPVGKTWLLGSLVFFAIGVLLYALSKRRPAEAKETAEDDY
jgi:hypothetical protein